MESSFRKQGVGKEGLETKLLVARLRKAQPAFLWSLSACPLGEAGLTTEKDFIPRS